jgi:hydroxypyruvate reductase
MSDKLETVFRATLAALSAEALVVRELASAGAELLVVPEVTVFALGKPAIAMARAARRVLPRCSGVIVAPSMGTAPDGFELLIGNHPVPDERSLQAGSRLLQRASQVPPDGAALFLIAGGGSALAVVPADGVSLADKQKVTHALLRSGAPISEINVVRKHLSKLKGGQLAAACTAAYRTTLVISDVLDGGLDAVASGPTVADPSHFADALNILSAHNVETPPSVLEHLRRGADGLVQETPKPRDARLAGIDTRLLADLTSFAREAAEVARRSGYQPRITGPMRSDVEAEAARLANEARHLSQGELLICSGEVSVRPEGNGRGGRAQHLALLLARELTGSRFEILVAGSDGHDFTSEAAGAKVDGNTWQEARDAGLDPDEFLRRFDSATLCWKLGAQIPTFESDTNLTDLVLIG